jgi:hypothetical protein
MPKKREQEEKIENKKGKKTFVWKSLRISFWVMIGLYIASLILNRFIPNATNLVTSTSPMLLWILIIIGLVQGIAIIFTFVTSIIHLRKYKEKTFAIVALVLSSLSLLSLLLEVLIILGGGAAA